MKKLLLSLFFFLTLGFYVDAKTIEFDTNTNSLSITGSAYTATKTAQECNVGDYKFGFQNYTIDASQMVCRGNQTGTSSNFSFYNDTPIDNIESITLTINGGSFVGNKIYLNTSSTKITTHPSSVSGSNATVENGVVVIKFPEGSTDQYFRVFFNKGATSGTASINKITITIKDSRQSPELAYAKTEDTYNIGSGEYTAPTITAKDGFDLSRLTYGSDNETVATVDETGKVTPVAEGTAKITATFTALDTDEFASEEVSYSLTVTDPRQDNGLAYSAAEYTANINEPFTNPLTNPNSLAVTYSSSDEAVATVNENGEVSPLAVGTAVITATFAGNASFKTGSVSYALKVVDPNALEETLVANDFEKTTTYNDRITKEGVYATYMVRSVNNLSNFQISGGNTDNQKKSGIAGNSKDGFYRVVSIEVNENKGDKVLAIYGRNTPYEGPMEIINATPGENALGTISKVGDKYTFTDEYTSFCIKAGETGTFYINNIVVTWTRIKSFAPEFVTAPGKYTGSVEVGLSANQEEGVKIYYTTDGTEPSVENGTLYEGPFELTATATVKAIAVEEGMKPSSVIEGEFIVRKPLDENQIFIDFTDNLKKFEKPDIVDYTATEGQDISGVEFISADGGNVTVTASNATYSNGLAASEGSITFKAYWNPITKIEVNGENLSNLTFVTDNAEAANADAEMTEAPLTYDNADGASEVVLNVNGAAKIKDVTVTSKNIQTGIEEIFGEESNAPARWFNLQGIEVNADNLTPGLYIVNRAGKSVKVIVK